MSKGRRLSLTGAQATQIILALDQRVMELRENFRWRDLATTERAMGAILKALHHPTSSPCQGWATPLESPCQNSALCGSFCTGLCLPEAVAT